MDKETKQMFNLIIDKLELIDKRFDQIDNRFDQVDQRLDQMEQKVKDQINGLDGKIDLIYLKLKADIDELKDKTQPRYAAVREE